MTVKELIKELKNLVLEEKHLELEVELKMHSYGEGISSGPIIEVYHDTPFVVIEGAEY